jgi:hypothetical protein
MLIAAEDAVAVAAQKHGISWRRPAGNVEYIARIMRKGGRIIVHVSDFGSIMTMLPTYAKNFADATASL